jgi:Ca2+:H+ antiporter
VAVGRVVLGKGGGNLVEASVWKRKVNFLLLGIPLVYALTNSALLGSLPHHALITFVLSALALIPLAGFLESAVEELAELLGEFVGGLLHTTGSNVGELAIGLSLLLSLPGSKAETIVLPSIAGVLIRNSLLFLGLATFLGCWQNGRMKFSAENAGEYSTVFALAVIGLCLPTLAHFVFTKGSVTEDLRILGQYSLGFTLAVILLVTYLAYIIFVVFHFRTEERSLEQRAQSRRGRRHRGQPSPADDFPLIQTQPDTQALFQEERISAEARIAGVPAHATAQAAATTESPAAHRRRHARAQLLAEKRAARAERGEAGFLAGHRVLRGLLAVVILGVSTAGVAYMSEQFARTIEEQLKTLTILGQPADTYEYFLGLVVIPVIAGLVELYGSVGMARRNKMEITMAVTAGASIQMILLVVPVLVIVGFLTGHPLNLIFTPLSVIMLGGATFAYMLLSRDGESTVMEGVQLISLWLLVAVTALILYPASA